MDTAFIWDAPDNGTDIVGGDVPGVFGTLFLGHTTDDTGIRAPQNVGALFGGLVQLVGGELRSTGRFRAVRVAFVGNQTPAQCHQTG